ncbi:hypothetical protein C0V72_15135 [Porphyrobacter sp. TH134]|nr:hypothetical protein C0V72_15135 [Porphyrobacter sp. TH134]
MPVRFEAYHRNFSITSHSLCLLAKAVFGSMAVVAEFLIKKQLSVPICPKVFLRQAAQEHPKLSAVMSL